MINAHQHPLTLTGFVLLALVQAGVPLSMIARREATLKNGSVLRIKTAPVDPYDAFRGRYVALSVENTFPTPKGRRFVRNQPVYVTFREDADGFASIADVASERPEEGEYVKARLRYWNGKKLHIRFPFDRYYMNEKLAPEAERVYRAHSRRGKRDAYIKVRVSAGFAVLEELYVDEKPIQEFLDAQEQ